MKRVLCVLLVFVMFLSACGTTSSEAPAAEKAPASAEGAAPAAPAVEEETIYGLPRATTLVYASNEDMNSLHPFNSQNKLAYSLMYYHVGDVLLWRAEDGSVSPRMAEYVKVHDDLTTWEIKLKDNIYGHNGQKLTAKDVKWSFETALSNYGEYAMYQMPFTTGVTGVEVIDELTCLVMTESPSNVFESWLFEAPILPSEYYDGKLDDEEVIANPKGFGPFEFVSRTPNDSIILKRFDNYWGEKPQYENLVVRIIPEESARLNELRAGSIDYAPDISPDNVEQVESEFSTLYSKIGYRKMQLNINLPKTHPALQDVRVRQALNYAIDKQGIIDTYLGGHTEPYAGHINPPNNNPNLEPYPYDPEKAMELLKEAGYEDGFDLTIYAGTSRYGLDKEITMQLAENLKAVGINCSNEYMEAGLMGTRTFDKDIPDLAYTGFAAIVSPAIEAVILTTTHATNVGTWINEEYDELYKIMSTTMDAEEFRETSYKMQEIVWEDCPSVFLWRLPVFSGMSKRIEWNARVDNTINLLEAKIVG